MGACCCGERTPWSTTHSFSQREDWKEQVHSQRRWDFSDRSPVTSYKMSRVVLPLTVHFVAFFLNISSCLLVSISVIGPDHPVVVLPGEDAVLLCHLSPPINAENMTIRWYRGHYYDTVHLHRRGQDSNEEQMTGYKRRTVLMKEGLKLGNVSLLIRSVTSSDSGKYSCMLDAGSFYEETVVELKVAALGSTPHLHLEESQGSGIQIVCTSSGWYPEPEALWKDDKGNISASSTQVVGPGQNFGFNIKTVYVVSQYSNKFYCRLSNPSLSQWKESMIHISDSFLQDMASCSIWRIAIVVCFTSLGACLIPLTIFQFAKQGEGELYARIGKLSEQLDWRRARSFAAEVTFDPDTAHPWLVISEDDKSVKHGDELQALPDTPERYNYSMCILGKEKLTSGRHYWEVEVGDKSGWSMGVYDECANRKGMLTVKPEGGYWLVQLKDDVYEALTEPTILLNPLVAPKALGLFLDYEAGRLSVYNLQDRSLLCTFPKASFPPVLRPIFNAGRIERTKNAGALRILPVIGW
ncbi:hypothetical protein NDU88_001224 [Pleurodeles waltl]|uniref:Butyrophilin subfamily 1 member A1-like n=1 Tax=Pleurodeles waltl TaxID=8319 RepID=A0AAV7Q6F7_PLEWA|nr:hypothetical protein NDU88_001224 [Pleurodeles waltl]